MFEGDLPGGVSAKADAGAAVIVGKDVAVEGPGALPAVDDDRGVVAEQVDLKLVPGAVVDFVSGRADYSQNGGAVKDLAVCCDVNVFGGHETVHGGTVVFQPRRVPGFAELLNLLMQRRGVHKASCQPKYRSEFTSTQEAKSRSLKAIRKLRGFRDDKVRNRSRFKIKSLSSTDPFFVIVGAAEEKMPGAWVVAAIFVSGTFLSGTLSYAQDKPLGDVAREARAQKAESPQAQKVVTDDDFKPAPPAPVAATDSPVAVVKKAANLLLLDSTHVCRRQTVNNSGPGWADDRVTEAAAPNRFHIVTTQLKTDPGRYETIIIGEDVYGRKGNEPWQKVEPYQAQLQRSAGALLPDVLMFGYQSGDLKLAGSESVDGAPTLRYEFKTHVGDMDRTIDIWVGANDNLPRKTHMLTVRTGYGTVPIRWTEDATCSYGERFTIEPPM